VKKDKDKLSSLWLDTDDDPLGAETAAKKAGAKFKTQRADFVGYPLSWIEQILPHVHGECQLMAAQLMFRQWVLQGRPPHVRLSKPGPEAAAYRPDRKDQNAIAAGRSRPDLGKTATRTCAADHSTLGIVVGRAPHPPVGGRAPHPTLSIDNGGCGDQQHGCVVYTSHCAALFLLLVLLFMALWRGEGWACWIGPRSQSSQSPSGHGAGS